MNNKDNVGLVLNYVDTGASYASLMQLALTAVGATTHAAVVNLLWTNLYGTAPTTALAALFVAMLDNGSVSVGELGAYAADLAVNCTHINLVGLQQTGLEYTQYA